MAIICAANAQATPDAVGRNWSLGDIVTVPDVTDLKLSDDRQHALYIVRQADVETDRVYTELRKVKLSDASQVVLLKASTIKELRRVPNSTDWTALIDLGEGIQLYRIDATGTVNLVVANPATVKVGSADQAVPSMESEAPHRVGILSYDWSPDGTWLFYSKLLDIGTTGKVTFDKAVTNKRDELRTPLEARIELRVRDLNGGDYLLDTRLTHDVIARYFGSRVRWETSSLTYRAEDVDAAGASSFHTYSWGMSDHVVRKVDEQSSDYRLFEATGLRGGILASEGFGPKRRLIEKMLDGSSHDYGDVAFKLGDPRGAGSFVSRDRKRAVTGMRYLDENRYGLAIVDAAKVQNLKFSGSLTRCDFDPYVTMGICIREGLNVAPELTMVDVRKRTLKRLLDVTPRHADLAELTITPRSWTNRLGYKASGFVVWPTDYDKSKSYPAIIVTHGSDADERFAKPDFQWNYPVQLFAQRGYIVVLMSESSLQDARMTAAFKQWEFREGETAPKDMRELIWLNPVYSMADAAKEMAAEGIIDPNRVGIAGYSRGSQLVNVAMTQVQSFQAASSGDGAHLEPFQYAGAKRVYDAIFGGSPLGPDRENYLALSPSLRANKVCGAVLEQMATPYAAAIDFYSSLREANVPAQITLYPGEDQATLETHIFHIPSNRVLAMRENLAWFDFWLRDRIDPDAPDPARVAHWETMKKARKACKPDNDK